MRYWAKLELPNLTNDQLHFERSERGRPMLKSLLPNWDFNVSHAGKFTVFVAEGLLQHQISVFQFTFLQLFKAVSLLFIKLSPRKFVKLCLDSSYRVQKFFHFDKIFFLFFKTWRNFLSEISHEKIRETLLTKVQNSFHFNEIFYCFQNVFCIFRKC